LLNSKVRRRWGQDKNLLSFAFLKSPNLSFVYSCPKTADKIVLMMGAQEF
jgi:hypothetical protein